MARPTDSTGFWCMLVLLAGCGGGSTGNDHRDTADGMDPGGDFAADGGTEGLTCATEGDCATFPIGPCERAVCRAETGLCAAVPDASKEGLACDDGDRCALTPKTCRSGVCAADAVKKCPDLPCHGPAMCNPATGECQSEAVEDKTSCDLDGYDCTKDYCAQGQCVAGPDLCECGPNRLCIQDPDLCTPRKECKDRVCVDVPGSVPDCSKAPPCQKSACSPASGDCVLTPEKDGVLCDDGDACTGFDVCQAGNCVGQPKDCDDHDPCTADGCAEAMCVHEPVQGQSCDDGDPCTYGDRCEAGTCTGARLDCDDSNPCTADLCLADQTCGHEPVAGPCDDANSCTMGDACVAAACVPGEWVPECCNADADCDDQDACTQEFCGETGTCERPGEADPGCATAQGCEAGFCDAWAGTCDAFDLSLPRLLLDWDFRGGKPAGLVWQEPGVLEGGGLGVKPGKKEAVFRLPARFVPQGVTVLHVDIDPAGKAPEAACELVTVQGVGLVEPSGSCGAWGDGVTAAWALQRGLVERLDVKIGLVADPGGPKVRGVRVYAWAGPECRPLRKTLVSGFEFEKLSVAGNPRTILVGFREDKDVAVAGFDLNGQKLASPAFATQADSIYFSTSLLGLADGRFLFAFGEVLERIHVLLLSPAGEKLSERVVDAFSLQDVQTQPRLVGPASGPWFLAWTSNRVDEKGLGVALARVGMTGDSLDGISAQFAVNQVTAGDQTLPTPCLAQDSGTMFWVSNGTQIVARSIVESKAVGDEVSLAAAEAKVSALTAVRLVDRCGVVWQTTDGRMAGRVVDDGLNALSEFAFPDWPAVERYSPSLVPAGKGGLLVHTRTEGTLSEVVQQLVLWDGTLASSTVLGGPINNATAYPTASPCGPFVSCFAYQDTVSVAKGIRVGLFSAACGEGPVRCDAIPAVCVGFGKTGYVELPVVSWGCP